MKRKISLLLAMILILSCTAGAYSPSPQAAAGFFCASEALRCARACLTRRDASPLAAHGALSVKNGRLTDAHGNAVQLRGVSTHGLAWYPQYVSAAAFRTLRGWGCSVVRLAMYTEEYGGYCVSGTDREALKKLLDQGVRCAAEAGLYVILDWHILSDGDPNEHLAEAKAFFSEMARKYAGFDNVLYEICNEPNGGVSWQRIKAYASQIIPAIRRCDADAVVLVGTPNWSQEPDKAAADPLTGCGNVMYTLHFYAATHGDGLRSTLRAACESGLPVFVSEFGVCGASGSGALDTSGADAWRSLMDRYGVSWCCWNLSNKNESSALLLPSVTKTSGWTAADLSGEGKWLLGALSGKGG